MAAAQRLHHMSRATGGALFILYGYRKSIDEKST
jgi:hypothetical protein